MPKPYTIAWMQNANIGMASSGRVVYRCPQNRYIFLNADHPQNRSLEYDAVFVCNHVCEDTELSFPKGALIINHNEPGYMDLGWNHFMFDKESVEQADILFSGLAEQYNVPLKYPYELLNFDWKRVSSYPIDILENKSKLISCVASSKTISFRHAERALYTEFLKTSYPQCDLFGRERNPISHLIYGLKDYRYSIAIENSIEPDFFTEKVLYCFYALTVPFYDGCSNLEHYFPAESFIRININDPQGSLELIRSVLANPNDYQMRLSALKEARSIFLKKYHLFDRVATELDEFYAKNPAPKKVRQLICAPKKYVKDHTEQINAGYLYAKKGAAYIQSGAPVPDTLKDWATQKARFLKNVYPHSFLIH